ncbi:MAG: phosphoribosyltransferase family protein, partial [Candidatus Cybelea sp.]
EKENGVPSLRRGFTLSPDDRALLVEDVLTTGLSMRETIGVVRKAGAQIVGLGVIVARGDVSQSLSNGEGLVQVLLDLPLRSYDESECPQCRAGEPISDPGSRRS